MNVTEDQARHIERNTREQRNSSLWYPVRQYRITASTFGSVLSRKDSTPSDSLVLNIIKSNIILNERHSIWDREGSDCIKEYVKYQHRRGHPDLTVSPLGFLVNPSHSFLGASPDGAVFDPSNPSEPFGFLEVKCPYTDRMLTSTDACTLSGFCSTVDRVSGQLHTLHQIQEQMAIRGSIFGVTFVFILLKN